MKICAKRSVNKLKTTIHFIILFQLISIIVAGDVEAQKKSLEVMETDVTGDHVAEYIHLEGEKFSSQSAYYRQIALHISSASGKDLTLTLEPGYDPTLEAIDINHDNVNDLFYQVTVDRFKNVKKQRIITLTQETVTDIPLPTNENVQAKLQPFFKLEINIPGQSKTITSPLTTKDERLTTLYDAQGNLLGERHLHVTPIHHFSVQYEHARNSYVLVGTQSILTKNGHHPLGVLLTTWYYHPHKKKWQLVAMQWQENSYT